MGGSAHFLNKLEKYCRALLSHDPGIRAVSTRRFKTLNLFDGTVEVWMRSDNSIRACCLSQLGKAACLSRIGLKAPITIRRFQVQGQPKAAGHRDHVFAPVVTHRKNR